MKSEVTTDEEFARYIEMTKLGHISYTFIGGKCVFSSYSNGTLSVYQSKRQRNMLSIYIYYLYIDTFEDYDFYTKTVCYMPVTKPDYTITTADGDSYSPAKVSGVIIWIDGVADEIYKKPWNDRSSDSPIVKFVEESLKLAEFKIVIDS